MSPSPDNPPSLTAQDVRFGDDDFTVDLSDGRTITIPLAWFPRLFHATLAERANWRWIGRGIGIHWPELDEDIVGQFPPLVFSKRSGILAEVEIRTRGVERHSRSFFSFKRE